MKRMIAFGLALVLVATGMPALAHQANYPGECDDRSGDGKCEQHDEVHPAHERCTGVRNHMWTSDGSLVQKSVGLAVAQETQIKAYLHTSDGDGGGDGAQSLMPGVVWVETNGFSGLQRTGYECQSPAHENPNEWQTHADQVLI